MTLLITIATKDVVYQSSDYRLSDGGKPVETENGAKQISAHGMSWIAQISFTGIARDGRGYDTRAWLQKTIASVGLNSPIEFLFETLIQRGTQALSTVKSFDNRLTVIVTAVEKGKPRLFIATNWEPLFAPAMRSPDLLQWCEVRIARPFIAFHGDIRTVPIWGRKRLNHLLTSKLLPHDRISSEIASINKVAAQYSSGTISEGCWVQALFANGDSFGRNYGEVSGNSSNIFVGGLDLAQALNSELLTPSGERITVLQSVGYMGPLTPAPTQEGEARKTLLSSPATSISIRRAPNEPIICALSTSGISTDLTVRKNKYSHISFGTVGLTANTEALRRCRPFAVRRLSLPCTPTVDGAQPRNWNYFFSLDFDGTTLKLNVMQNSMSFRSANLPAAMSLLQENEELVMVAPVGGMALSASFSSPTVSASLNANFLLRDFPELQRDQQPATQT